MTFGKGLIILVGSLALISVTSCETTPKGEGSGSETASTNSGPVNASGFLKTEYAPLKKWLDEAFEVDYKFMTPALIFDQVPLNDIYYETSNLPTGAEPFSFASSNVSRRELLKRIANHWKLKMSLVIDDSGNPTAVRVEG